MKTFVKRNPLTAFTITPSFLKSKIFPKTKVREATKLFLRLMKKIPPVTERYDAAVAFWGDRTMFFALDKVTNAAKKIAWMHFDYSTPPRDDGVYREYFSRCDAIVNVSGAVNDALTAKFPEIASKCVVIENIQNKEMIRSLALTGSSFPDASTYKGKRILTVGRISYQKGVDMIPPVLRRLKADGIDARWYIVGGGSDEEKTALITIAVEDGVADSMILLGETVNPYTYMRDCDVYAQPSRYEGKPIAVEEAKIMRCPIVTANYLSAKEQLADGKFGVIAEISIDSIYENIRNLLLDGERRRALSETLNRENFGNADEIEKFYRLL
ncbi:hypothetical protein FACS1894105_12280 [Clostridia bacterium]|nr:hypothetical protein FACS1894105_12280 [Clostridia bacterium]